MTVKTSYTLEAQNVLNDLNAVPKNMLLLLLHIKIGLLMKNLVKSMDRQEHLSSTYGNFFHVLAGTEKMIKMFLLELTSGRVNVVLNLFVLVVNRSVGFCDIFYITISRVINIAM